MAPLVAYFAELARRGGLSKPQRHVDAVAFNTFASQSFASSVDAWWDTQRLVPHVLANLKADLGDGIVSQLTPPTVSEAVHARR